MYLRRDELVCDDQGKLEL